VHFVTDAQAVLGSRFEAPDASDHTLDAYGAVIAAVALMALEQLRALNAGNPRLRELSELAIRGADLEVDLREDAVQRRKRALAGVEAGLGRLRSMPGSAEVVDNVCVEICRSCGFSRALLSRVEGNTLIPWITHFAHRPVRDDDREWMASARISLGTMALERELLEEHHAGLVVNALEDPRANRPFVAATRATSYVVAPVMPSGRVLGFLHADHYPVGRPADRIDRDILWAFAQGFGRTYERRVLVERLNAQRDHVRDALRSAESSMDSLARSELELARREEERSMVSGATALALAGERSALDELLTPREREVLSLIVSGQSNGAIAGRLVISEGTVKSHVKQILRKTGAANRSEAIARYLGLIGPA
jgi:DNA-binding CsgD family transcriptional regulator